MAVIRRLFIFFCFLSIFVGLFISYQVYAYYCKPIVLVEDVRFRIEPGSSLRKILKELSSHQDIKPFSKKWYEIFIRMHANTTKIKAGEYILKKNMTGSELISQLIKGKVVLHSLTLIEGWTFKDCIKAIHKHPAIKKTFDTDDYTQIREKLIITESSIEGFFFPETYYFPYGTTDRDFLLRAHQLMQKKLQLAWHARSPNLAIDSPYEALILASILEKESALVAEWPIISQVFHNRLKIKMRLQADPTVIYGLGANFAGRLNKDALK
ncbi:MAG TPA: endolytic transglycosylase MltG, partial [Gammaproteobacteria bacterium]|nr:endolytic transglycosylase MltG [Gammaproteobacteria bacterium]